MRKAGKSKFDQAVIDLVKAKRETKNLSQDALAEYLDVTRGYIGQVEVPASAYQVQPESAQPAGL